jgi:AcrR family transcriptional regulator
MAKAKSKTVCDPSAAAGAPPVPPSIWERLDAPRSGRTGLTHEQIAEAAVALADGEGLEAVSMRRLAEALGVSTMALYRYVDSKDELLELMTDAVIDTDVLTAEASSDWRTLFREIARRRRANLLVERMLAALAPLPLTGDQKMRLIRAVDAYARGASDGEVNQRRMLERRGHGADGDVRLLLRSNMQWALRSGRYPHFSEVVHGGLAPVDAEAEFDLGIDAMLDGLAARFGI